jgi:hypothetical protein
MAGSLDEVITVGEAARLKGVTTQSVYRALWSGWITGEKREGTWLITKKSLSRWEVYGHAPTLDERAADPRYRRRRRTRPDKDNKGSVPDVPEIERPEPIPKKKKR